LPDSLAIMLNSLRKKNNHQDPWNRLASWPIEIRRLFFLAQAVQFMIRSEVRHQLLIVIPDRLPHITMKLLELRRSETILARWKGKLLSVVFAPCLHRNPDAIPSSDPCGDSRPL